MPEHNLPAFKSEESRDRARFPRPNRAGDWVEQQGSLKVLGQSLRVEDDPFSDPDEPIRAIPDPWAQARTFAEALLDRDHSMHAPFVSQWRGLLALLALRSPDAGYAIDVRPLALGDQHLFDKVLSRLHPRVAIAEEIELWTRPAVVYVSHGGQRRTVAMLNPACLISPGRLAQTVQIPDIHWAQRGFSDPLNLKGDHRLPARSLVLLRQYLENLRARLGELKQNETGDTVRERLQNYIDDIDADLGVSRLTASVGGGAYEDLPRLYQPLLSSVELKPAENPAADSECRLVLKSQSGHGAFKGLILVDESLGRAAGARSARDMLVWGTRTLSELLTNPNTLEAVKREAAEQGYLVVTLDDLFTPRAVVLRKTPRIPGHTQATRNMPLPVRPIALLLDGHLPNNVNVELDHSRAFVTLKIKLEREGTPVTHTVSRNFRSDAQHGAPLLLREVDWVFLSASVWPNFRSSSWDRYFARLYHPQDEDRDFLRPVHAISRAIIDSALSEAPDGQQAVALLSQINAGLAPGANKDWFRVSELKTEREHDQVQVSSCGFESIFYSAPDKDHGEAPAGLVWLDISAKETQPSSTACVAVDFGTTNTVACFEDSVPIQFQERLVHPIGFEENSKVTNQRFTFRWQFVDFFPPERRDLPTPTVVIGRKDAPEETEISIFRNIVYFNPTGMHAQGSAAEEINNYRRSFNRCMFNLKWSEEPKHVAAAADYLSQMMLMIAAESVERGVSPTSLKWRFSLPDSMPSRTRQKFEQHLTQLSGRHGALDGLHSEGVAAAKYMLAGNSGAEVVPGSINAILDIGGGTTDVTLWDNEVPLWRGSFKLAGQSFFTNTFVRNPSILREIGLGEVAELLEPAGAARAEGLGGLSPQDVPHLAELLFSGPALSKAMDQHWALKLNLKVGAGLRTAGLVFIGGIAYYLGLVARELIAARVIDEDALRDPAFALCGRGAGLFGRIHGPLQSDGRSDVTSALRLFSHAAKAAEQPRPRLFFEPDSKLEVVRGMVTDYALIDSRIDARQEARSDIVPAGLGVTFRSGKALEPRESVLAVPQGEKANRIDLAPLHDFLQQFEREVEIGIDIRPDQAEGAHAMISNEVRAGIDAVLKDQTGLQEPLFITALRELIRDLTKSEDDPKRRVVVKGHA